jgi:hypothetical protein
MYDPPAVFVDSRGLAVITKRNMRHETFAALKVWIVVFSVET